MKTHATAWAALLALTAWSSSAGAQILQAINQPDDALAVLRESARECGLELRESPAHGTPLTGDVLAWEARRDAGCSLTRARADEIEAYVRNGGNLLISCGIPTWAELYRLTQILPTTGWHGLAARPPELEAKLNKGASIADWDRVMFPDLDLTGPSVGYHYSLRPFHQIERGIQRYERYPMTWRHLGKSYIFTNQDRSYDFPADHTFWSRPLDNRSWREAVVLDNIDRTALLLTGRCGSGRVAVFASGISETASWPEASAFWRGVLQWLLERADIEPSSPAGIPSTLGEQVAHRAAKTGMELELLEDPGARTVGVRLRNSTAASVDGEIVIRMSTWQRALIGDVAATVRVPARGEVIARWPLPKPTQTDYQALSELDEYDLRVGVLSADGGTWLIDEFRERISFESPVRVKVRTDNLYTVDAYPFAGSAMDAPQGGAMQHASRMGFPVHAYAYKPGVPVSCTVEVTNGLRNLSPLATVTDETDPGNVTVCAINDQGGSYNQNCAVGDGIIGYGDWKGRPGTENVLRFDFPEPVTLTGVTLIGNVRISPEREKAEEENPGAVLVEIDGREVATVDNLDGRFRADFGRTFLPLPETRGRVVRLCFPWIPTVAGTGAERREPRLADIELGGTTGDELPRAASDRATWRVMDALSGESVATGECDIAVPGGGRSVAEFRFLTPELPDRRNARPLRIEVTCAGETDSVPVLVIDPPTFMTPPTPRATEFYASYGVRRCFPLGTGTREKLRDPPSVAQPDDQTWCYARHIQDGGDHRPNRMFAGNQGLDFIPRGWMEFNNGKPFFDLGAEHLVKLSLARARSLGTKKVSVMLSDHWHAAPQLSQSLAWQHLVAFDDHLRAQGGPGLVRGTHAEICKDIETKYYREWTLWNLDYYLDRLRGLKAAFDNAGLELVIHSQNFPIVPTDYAAELAEVIAECNDDCTWVMVADNEPLTTARHMVQKIYNPYFRWATLLNWGWVSSMLGSPTWQHPVGTCETSRRKYLNRAWLGCLDFDNAYRPINQHGFKFNGNHAFNLGEHEWQEWWKLGEQIAFLWPEQPLGPGFVFSNSRFSRDGEPLVGVGEFTLRDHPSLHSTMYAWRALYESGVPLTFGANARSLPNYAYDNGLVLVNVSDFSESEIDAAIRLKKRGVGLVAVMGGERVADRLAAAFGVDVSGRPTTGRSVASVLGRDVVGGDGTLFYPLHFDEFTPDRFAAAGEELVDVLGSPIRLPPGVTGYANARGSQLLIVLEDRFEEGRVLKVQLEAKPGGPAPRACLLTDHSTLSVALDGDWWIVDVPTRPGDGNVVCVEAVSEVVKGRRTEAPPTSRR